MADYIDDYIREQRTRDRRSLGRRENAYTRLGDRREAATVKDALATRMRPGIDPGFTRPDTGAPFGRERGERLGREDVTSTVIGGPGGGRSDLAPYQRPQHLFGEGATDTEMRALGYDPAAINKARESSHAPIHAGSINGNKVEITGPNKIRMTFADGGSAEFVTSHGGKPIAATDYLAQHGNFQPTPEFSQKQSAGVREAGAKFLAEKGALPPFVHSRGPEQFVRRSGTDTPVAQLSPEERMSLGVGTVSDRLFHSPTAKVLGQTARSVAGDFMSGARRLFGGFNAPEVAATGAATAPGNAAVPPIGASRSQAARIDKPTGAQPVPTTETAPQANVNTGKLSTAPTPGVSPGLNIAGQGASQPAQLTLPQDWQNRRMQFSGF